MNNIFELYAIPRPNLTLNKNLKKETLTKDFTILEKPKTKKNEINASRVWKCCKCKTENYQGESTCNWYQHSRCGSCRSLV